MTLNPKRLIPAALLLIMGTIGVVTNPLAGIASTYNTEIAASGAAIYGSLRFASSAMSVAKDADIAGSVAIASVTLSPGQVLEPVTATINRMADLLFGLVLASGVISVTLPAVARIGAVLLCISGILLAAAQYAGTGLRSAGGGLRRLGVATARLGAITAILVPGAYSIAFLLGDFLTADAWRSATAVFETLSEDFNAPTEAILIAPPATATTTEAEPKADPGLFGGLVDGVGDAIGQTKDAIVGAAQATAGFAAGLPDQVSRNAKIVGDGIAISGQLFSSSIQLGAAYLVRLLVLPIFLLLTGLWLMRHSENSGRTFRPEARPAASVTR